MYTTFIRFRSTVMSLPPSFPPLPPPSLPSPPSPPKQGLAASLCQLMQYICAYVQLSGGLDKSNDFAYEKKEFGGFWGGTESIGKCICS